MTTRRLGRTGLDISELVFGGGWVGGILIDADADTRLSAVQKAMAAGVNWIDTAPMYGQGVSETHIGELLPQLEQRPMLSTKVRIDPDAGDLRGQIERSLEQSLTRLKTDRVELLQLHNPVHAVAGDGVIDVKRVIGEGGVADVFDDLKAQGSFDHIGITALGETDALVEVVDSGRFDTAQVYYNLLNSSAGRDGGASDGVQDFANLLGRMRAQNMGALGIRVFAAGVIATDQRHGREIMVAQGTDVSVDEARTKAVFTTIGDTHGTRAQTAIRYALGCDALSGIVFGLATLEHLDDALAAWRRGSLDDATIGRINAAVDGGFGV